MTTSSSRPVREIIALQEVGHTAISRACAAALALFFGGVIAAVPLVQAAFEWAAPGRPVPQVFSILRAPARAVAAFRRGAPSTAPAAAGSGGLFRRILAANTELLAAIEAYEARQREDSLLTRTCVAPWQRAVTRTLGLGNEKAYPGLGDWAFYRLSVDYAAGRPFLDEAVLRNRVATGTAWKPAPHPDPRPAIRAFHRYLASRGIALILLPAPAKTSVHPDAFSRRYGATGLPVRNASWTAWQQELEDDGIPVMDAAALLRDARTATGDEQFLRTDTHWRPEAMARVAAATAARIRRMADDERFDATGWRQGAVRYTAPGDIAANLLRLETGMVYPAQTVSLRPVNAPGGEPWVPDPDGPVLLLGDSYASIFTAPDLGWGEGAGLGPQLAHALGCGVDVIAINDNGAYAPCLELARALGASDRLAGKRVVVWEFAERELAFGDWRPVDWTGLAAISGRPETGPAHGAVAEGILRRIARPPRPKTKPYKDCLVQAHLTVTGGLDGCPEMVVYVWGMRNDVWTEAASWEVGRRLQLRVQPWDQAAHALKLGSIQRIDLDDPEWTLLELPLYWGEEASDE